MKHINKYTRFFGWLAVAMMLLTTSCKDDLFEGSNGLSDEVTVSFTLTPEAAATVATRGAEDEEGRVTYPGAGEYAHISDGSKADMLIYAVYDSKNNLLTGYGENEDGQTIIKDIKKFPITINLTLKRGETYKVAFWAQSSKCNAYDTKDLKKVEVIYGEIDTTTDDDNTTGSTSSAGEDDSKSKVKTTTPNNDEFRDAFCRSIEIVAGQNDNHNIYLYRPLAQINIGTNGYDFESITRHAPKKYLYSKIRLNRVARYLNVVSDSTYSSTTDAKDPYGDNKTAEAFAVVDFGYARIPAYVNYTDDESSEENTHLAAYPTYVEFPSYTKWDWENSTGDPSISDEDVKQEDYKAEEFLKVHLYENRDVKKDDERPWIDKTDDDYRVYANLNDYGDKNYQTETFKYLSMCYVLTSSTEKEKITINNVKMWLATDEDGKDSIEVVNLNNVPAQRNWRTNIIGNLLTEDQTFSVTLDRDFAGEYNGWQNPDWQWSGPLADGVYYDAAKDEIQISNVNGLLWFQRMVNGDLKVRRAEHEENIGNYYPYNVAVISKTTGKIEKEETKRLKYDGISGESITDEVLRQRILKATHQDKNTNSDGEKGNNGWPKNNNFHFCGSNGPAHVKLMADIDLSGIEWIPIGYEMKVRDTTTGAIDSYDVNHKFDETDGTQRAFCGVFDGNNHTISNLTSKRFTAKVHDESLQGSQKKTTGSGYESKQIYDCIQWMPVGLFGLVSGCETSDEQTEKTTIKNVRMLNTNVFGYHTGGAIAGIVNSIEKNHDVDILNCLVDGGSVELSPMFRGDVIEGKNRTFARGIYAGGIVGQYTSYGTITGCEVRNAFIRAYRQIGGLVGSVSNQDISADSNIKPTISGNKIYNLLIIADKFQPYDSIYNVYSKDSHKWKNGFGWVTNQASLANYYVGGTEDEIYTDNTGAESSQKVEFRTGVTDKSDPERVATVDAVPLRYIPMLSSWFCDKINLTGNYYGQTSVYIDRRYYDDFPAYSTKGENSPKYSVPFRLPYELSVDYDTSSPKAAMYVESVTLDGSGSIGDRSVITPDDVQGDSACVMYVTSRDREQFWNNGRGNEETPSADAMSITYKKPTIIKNVVLRGSPYAWAGIIFEPNKNMTEVRLEKVFIYDVYHTLVQRNQDAQAAPWYQNNVQVPLTVIDSNFRGYTAPGKGWSQITYEGTTFEQGTSTGHTSLERVCKVEAPTDFRNCYFKAPYRIDLSEAVSKNIKVTFDEDGKNKCYATSTSTKNVPIDLTGKTGCTRIRIESDDQGNPIVTYLNAQGNPIE